MLLLLKTILKTPTYHMARTARIHLKSHSAARKYMLYSKGTVCSIGRACPIHKYYLSILLSNRRQLRCQISRLYLLPHRARLLQKLPHRVWLLQKYLPTHLLNRHYPFQHLIGSKLRLSRRSYSRKL